MNTMMPFAPFSECARVHPTRALHRQIIEADDCLRHLFADPAYPPRRKTGHPCVEMWRYNKQALRCYRDAFIHEWLQRTLVSPPAIYSNPVGHIIEYPHWHDDPDLHATYREHMLAKYGATSTQPDTHFIHASRDWTERPVLHKPFPFPKEDTP